jgi:hypothetical protein
MTSTVTQSKSNIAKMEKMHKEGVTVGQNTIN